jgi:hypothetical protein
MLTMVYSIYEMDLPQLAMFQNEMASNGALVSRVAREGATTAHLGTCKCWTAAWSLILRGPMW